MPRLLANSEIRQEKVGCLSEHTEIDTKRWQQLVDFLVVKHNDNKDKK